MPATAIRFQSRLRSWSVQVATEWGRELPAALRPLAPIGKATPTSTRPPGELRKSIMATPAIPTGSGARFHLRAPVIQAATTDKGARPHIIRARRAKVLRFYWPNGPAGAGTYHFRHVNHPGNAAQNWWEPGLARIGSSTLRKAARRVRF